MDNPQERSVRLGYLVGMIEGDGMITLGSVLSLPRSMGLFSTPMVRITNTNPVIINECRSILRELNVGHHLNGPKRTKRGLLCQTINVAGLKRVKRLLEQIGPWLKGKARQGAVVMEFIRHREAGPKRRPYGEYERHLIGLVQRLNKPNPTEILRDFTPGAAT